MSLLKRQRELSGITIAELSKRTEIDATALSKVEHGRRRLTAEEVGRIARALGCRTDDLIPGMKEFIHAYP
jgi:transcriptional regulator with XRE-family HTH domain